MSGELMRAARSRQQTRITRPARAMTQAEHPELVVRISLEVYQAVLPEQTGALPAETEKEALNGSWIHKCGGGGGGGAIANAASGGAGGNGAAGIVVVITYF